MRTPKVDTPQQGLAYVQEAARRTQELFPHIGVTIGLTEDGDVYLLELSDYQPVKDNLLTPLFLEYYEELKSIGLPFEIVYSRPNTEALRIKEPLGYLPPLAQAA